MNTVHFVMSDTFAGIEQHVDELLSNNLLKKTINDKYLIPLNIDSNFEYLEMFTKNDKAKKFDIISLSILVF